MNSCTMVNVPRLYIVTVALESVFTGPSEAKQTCIHTNLFFLCFEFGSTAALQVGLHLHYVLNVRLDTKLIPQQFAL